jgi:hypothetical protein
MKRSLTVLALLVAALAAAAGWYVFSKQPTRQGMVELQHLQGSVTVRYDERGIPHIRAENETDLYRALGYVHAQDRLFQMEVLRRLARGELAEVLGPKLLDTDKLMRSLRIRERADTYLANMDKQSPAFIAMQAYLDGINQYQDTHPFKSKHTSEPARDSVSSANIDVACHIAIASKLAPTKGLVPVIHEGRRTTLTFPLPPPPQKNLSPPSNSSPETPTPSGILRLSRTSPVFASTRRSSLSSRSHVPCHRAPSTKVTPVTKRLDSMVRRILPFPGSIW